MTRKKPKRVSARMVAEMAGVSLTTVSHVLNNKQPYVNQFSEETKQRILDCARKLNYRPNLMAAGLKSGKSRLFAIVLGDVWSHPYLRWAASGYDGQLISGVNASAAERGLFPVIGLYREEEGKQQTEVAETLIQAGVDGVIVKGPNEEMLGKIAKFSQDGISFVLVFPHVKPDFTKHWIDVDNTRCGAIGTEALIQAGCKNILFVNENADMAIEQERERGHREALARHGLPVLEVQTIKPVEAKLTEADTKALRDRVARDRIDGILTSRGGSGLCVMRARQELGLDIPDAVKLVTFDCSYAEEAGVPGLTSIEAPWFQAGLHAVERLAQITEGQADDLEPIILEPVIQVSDSCPVAGEKLSAVA